MGIGDEIMASGHARVAYERAGRKQRVMITDLRGTPRWSGVWKNLPWIAHPIQDKHATDWFVLQNGPRCRPYIDYVKGFTRGQGINFRDDWRARDYVGEIIFDPYEREYARDMAAKIGPFVIVEPLVKTSANPNKQWGRAKWQALADLLRAAGLNPIQIGPPSTARLEGIPLAVTQDFRFGAAMLEHARWSFLPDGGLHHAAAALKLPATVLWGGANDPDLLGYPGHVNIATPPICGRWTPCPHCRAIWQKLTPQEVFERTREVVPWLK